MQQRTVIFFDNLGIASVSMASKFRHVPAKQTAKILESSNSELIYKIDL